MYSVDSLRDREQRHDGHGSCVVNLGADSEDQSIAHFSLSAVPLVPHLQTIPVIYCTAYRLRYRWSHSSAYCTLFGVPQEVGTRTEKFNPHLAPLAVVSSLMRRRHYNFLIGWCMLMVS
jgi:hypothetical protein